MSTYAEKNAAENLWVSIEVTDTGVGIKQEDYEQIFDRFFQGDLFDSELNQGSGIGLSIAREFVHLHGGEIHVKSRLSNGSTFRIDLPLRTVAANTLTTAADFILDSEITVALSNPDKPTEQNLHSEAADGYGSDKSLKRQTILIVEDSDEFRLHLHEALQNNYRVVEATDGREGWQKALSSHPDLIISDIAMPRMDGVELSRKLKGDKRTSQIPVILLTASATETSQIYGLHSGANDYLSKPFNFEILHARIKNQLRHNEVLKSTFSKQLSVVPGKIAVESKNEQILRKIVLYVEDNLNNPQLSVEDLSKHVNMSRGSLYSKLMELTGKPPVDFIRSIKLDKAAALMETSELNIGEISFMVGFAAQNYFTKAFKARFGMLPKEYMIMKRQINESKRKIEGNDIMR